MKNIFRNIFLVAVAALYFFSTMGYGVHKCSSEGTASLILLCGGVPCESAHSDSHSDSHSDADGHECGCCHKDECGNSHSKECCSTNVYKVSDDQTAAETNIDVAPVASDLCFPMAEVYKILSASQQNVSSCFNLAARDCVPQASLAVLCSLRV